MDECALSPCLVNAGLTVLARACRREKKKKEKATQLERRK